ncbi:MAG: thioredoxin family protein [Opitutales bacterium]|nr:thioredoxin family protein [Opitutales bacterium]
MKKLTLFACVFALFAAFSAGAFSVSSKPAAKPAPSASSSKINWLLDFNEALDNAKAENKPLIVLFTGSDWCIWCKRLDAATLSKPEFSDYANKNYVMLLCDFPQAGAKPAQIKKNEALARSFGIEGFPTLVLIDANSGKSVRFGYSQADTPEKFFEFVEQNLPKLKAEK